MKQISDIDPVLLDIAHVLGVSFGASGGTGSTAALVRTAADAAKEKVGSEIVDLIRPLASRFEFASQSQPSASPHELDDLYVKAVAVRDALNVILGAIREARDAKYVPDEPKLGAGALVAIAICIIIAFVMWPR